MVRAGLPQPRLRVTGFQWSRDASGHTKGGQDPRQELGSDARAVARDQATEAQGCQRGHMAGCHLPSGPRKLRGWWEGGETVLTPAAHCVFATRHDIFALLVFTRNHFKLDGCVTHSMVSLRKNKDNGDIG